MDLRISETARQVGCTAATIRNYISRFDGFLSSTATQPTMKRFTPRDVAMLREIRRLLLAGATYAEIPAMLPSFAEIVEEIPEPPPTTTSELQPLELMEQFQNLLEQQYETFRETVNAKDELISELRKDKEKLENELKDARRPWWRRK